MHGASVAGHELGQPVYRVILAIHAVQRNQVPRNTFVGIIGRTFHKKIGNGLDDRLFHALLAQQAEIVGTDFAGAQHSQHPAVCHRAVQIPRRAHSDESIGDTLIGVARGI